MFEVIPLPAAILLLLSSAAALVYFSERAVDRIVGLSEHFGLSGGFVGLTIFSFTTSLPEIFAHITASIGILQGRLEYDVASATVVGANIGSDVFQQTILLGIAVILMGRVHFSERFSRTAFVPMIAAAVLVWVLTLNGHLSRLEGGLLVACFFAYMAYLYRDENTNVVTTAEKTNIRPLEDSFLALLFLTLMLAAAHILLTSTETIVSLTGIGGSLIGALTLGVAAASPELFTALSAARKKKTDMSRGVLIGSNITNPILALGVGALISTYSVPNAIIAWDLPLKILSAIGLYYFLRTSTKAKQHWLFVKGYLDKKAGIYLLLCYVVFVAIRVIFFRVDIIV